MGWAGGGGSDGSAEIRADEARRERDMALASREINSLFGIYNPDNFSDTGEFLPYAGKNPDALSYVDWSRQTYGDSNPWIRRNNEPERDEYGRLWNSGRSEQVPRYSSQYGQYMADQGWSNQQSVGWQGTGQSNDYLGYGLSTDIEGPYGAKDFGSGYSIGSDPALAQTAYANYLAREAAYDKNRADIMSYFTHGLDEQLQESAQAQTYDLARRGLLKGSEDFQAEAGRTRRYDDALFKLTNQADSSVSGLRSADEQARLNLLGNIRAGMDRESAVAGATAALRNNIDTAANAAYATDFSNLFGDLNDIYKTYNYRTGQNRGTVMPYGGGYSPGSKV